MGLGSLWRSILDALDNIADELSPSLASSTPDDSKSTQAERECACREINDARPDRACRDEGKDTLDSMIGKRDEKIASVKDDAAENGTLSLPSKIDRTATGSRDSIVGREMSAHVSTSDKLAVDWQTPAGAESSAEEDLLLDAKKGCSGPACDSDEPAASEEDVGSSVGNRTRLGEQKQALTDISIAADEETGIETQFPVSEEKITVANDKPRNGITLHEKLNGICSDWLETSDGQSFGPSNHLPSASAKDVVHGTFPGSPSTAPSENLVLGADDFVVHADVWQQSEEMRLLPGQQTCNRWGADHATKAANNDTNVSRDEAGSNIKQNEEIVKDVKTSPSSDHGGNPAVQEVKYEQSKEDSHRIESTSGCFSQIVTAEAPSSPTAPMTPLADTSELEAELLSPRSTTSRHSSASFSSTLSRKSNKWSATEPAQAVVSISRDNASPSAPSRGSNTQNARDALRSGVPKAESRARYRNVLSRGSTDPSSAKRLKLRGGGAGAGVVVKKDGKASISTGTWGGSYGFEDGGMLI